MEHDVEYQIYSTNACSEQPLVKHGMCMLSSINVSRYVENPFTDDWFFNAALLEEDIYKIVRAMDDIVDENILVTPLQEQKDTAQKYRNIGIGIMGLADLFVMCGMKYGSEESKKFAKNVMKFVFEQSLRSSIKLAKERGSFPGYGPHVWDSEIIRNNFDQQQIKWFKEQDCLRNCSLLSIAPTGSIGTMLQISTGCEPFFALSYKRRTISMGDNYYDVNIPTLELYKSIKGEDADISNFVTSKDIAWIDRIGVQSALQSACDTAISSTCNLPKETTLDEIKKIYLEAWKQGCKGFTVYVEGSRNPILSTSGFESNNGQVAKRPKELEADYYAVKVKNEIFEVVVGLLNGKPYEVFALRSQDKPLPAHKGKIIKVKKMHYKFESEYKTIPDLQLNGTSEEKAATLYASMLMRHNADLKYIIKTAKKVNDNISSFTSAMCRVLSKYIGVETLEEKCPECGGQIIREAGCCKCNECGWARCE